MIQASGAFTHLIIARTDSTDQTHVTRCACPLPLGAVAKAAKFIIVLNSGPVPLTTMAAELLRSTTAIHHFATHAARSAAYLVCIAVERSDERG